MVRRIIALDEAAWEFGAIEQKPFSEVYDIVAVREWLPAVVPGDVRLDLLRLGKIGDPFWGMNNVSSQWIDGQDWWYRTLLPLRLTKGERAFLIFEGIDYQSAVFCDDIGFGRHTGMFSRQVYEIRNRGNSAPPARIGVRIWGSNALPRRQRSIAQRMWQGVARNVLHMTMEPYADRCATLKCQMQFGWDFAPRLRTCGIWDDTYIVIVGSIFIEDAWVKSTAVDTRSRTCRLDAELTVNSDRAQRVRLLVTVQGKDSYQLESHSFDLALDSGRQPIRCAFELEGPRFWNPWDRGEPDLYDVTFDILPSGSTVPGDSAEPSDSYTSTIGIRSIELAPTEGAVRNAEPWAFVINGEREFVRGANWVPLDAMPGRLRPSHYAERLAQVKAANINFLRVWGGGLREKRAFYELCDEMGILVWQEFPFSGALFDRFPSEPAFLDLVDAECRGIVRTVRQHPSVVVWCGGNEFSVPANRAVVDTLRRVTREEDGTRPFKPASPYKDEDHNWRVWHRGANLREYNTEASPFLSEFGLQSAPNLASLTKFLPEDQLFPPNEFWTYHHAQLGKLYRYAHSVNPHPESLPAFVEATQRAQVLGIQIAIEHMRRSKGKKAGVVVWQFNDAWPAISWSLVDYYGTPKLAYAELQKLYAPVFVSFDYSPEPRRPGDTVHGVLWVINDLRQPIDVEVQAYLNGEPIYHSKRRASLDSVERLDALDIQLRDGPNLLRLEWSDGDRRLDHTYDLNLSDAGEMHPLFTLAYPLYTLLTR